VLTVEGAPRAALYGWRLPDRFAFYQAGYDPDWQQRSVGTVLLGHVIARAFAEGLAEFDFLRGTEPYKLVWANGARDTVRLRVRADSLRARLHHAGRNLYWRLREAGKRALPPTTLDWARRARRKVRPS
jgi:CelD/BcsL family acetyltransferase involved in cellulose biosynthesis